MRGDRKSTWTTANRSKPTEEMNEKARAYVDRRIEDMIDRAFVLAALGLVSEGIQLTENGDIHGE